MNPTDTALMRLHLETEEDAFTSGLDAIPEPEPELVSLPEPEPLEVGEGEGTRGIRTTVICGCCGGKGSVGSGIDGEDQEHTSCLGCDGTGEVDYQP